MNGISAAMRGVTAAAMRASSCRSGWSPAAISKRAVWLVIWRHAVEVFDHVDVGEVEFAVPCPHGKPRRSARRARRDAVKTTDLEQFVGKACGLDRQRIGSAAAKRTRRIELHGTDNVRVWRAVVCRSALCHGNRCATDARQCQKPDKSRWTLWKITRRCRRRLLAGVGGQGRA